MGNSGDVGQKLIDKVGLVAFSLSYNNWLTLQTKRVIMDVDNDGAGIGQVFQHLAVQMANVSSALNA